MSDKSSSDAGAEKDDDDHRGDPRRRTLLTGQVVFKYRNTILDCTIRDVSEGGALLRFRSVVQLPDLFELHLNRGGALLCEPVRHLGDAVAVRVLRRIVQDEDDTRAVKDAVTEPGTVSELLSATGPMSEALDASLAKVPLASPAGEESEKTESESEADSVSLIKDMVEKNLG